MAVKSKKKIIFIVLGILFVLVILFHDFASEQALEKELQSKYAVGDPQFIASVNNLLGPELRNGNRTQTLLNGNTYPSMLEAIRSAKKTITFETYIYWSGKIGKQFTDALAERARNGVRIHLMLDWLGSQKMEDDLLQEMKDAGVQVIKYNPDHWYTIAKLNNRTHRKIMVVDGKVGFTGGLGVADHWLGNAESPEHWRDTHFRFEGPVVSQMQSAFVENWLESEGVLLHGEDYFPPLEPAGKELAQVIKSSPTDGSEVARLLYLLSIASARKSILIANAYFVPDELAIQHFVSAAKRGVKIQIIVPGKVTDTTVVRQAGRSLWGDLLKANVEIYEYQPTMFHVKSMVVDEIWSSVGSTNFDNRSFRLHDEANLNILDADFAAEQVKIFQEDLKKSKRITYDQWKNRSIKDKFTDWLASLLRHQL